MSARSVGFLGLGRMGAAMAGRLVECGYALRVHNRTAAACDPFVPRGVRPAREPAGVAESGGLVVSMLATREALQAACSPAFLQALGGGTHIVMTTLAPEAARSLAAAHALAGVAYVSAPVQGRPAMAASGQLVGWASGARAGPVDEVLGHLCRQVIWLGDDVALAPAAKLALNFLMFGNIALFAEAMAYVSRHGVDSATFAQGVTGTAFAAPLFQAIAAGLLAGDPPAQGSDIALVCKDLSLLLASEDDDRLLPTAQGLLDVFRRAADAGLGDADPVAVRRVFDPS